MSKTMEEAIAQAERLELAAELSRGQALIEAKASGVSGFLRDRGISKMKAYGLMQLAQAADDLVNNGLLDSESLGAFTARSLLATHSAYTEVQEEVCASARDGQKITSRVVAELEALHHASNSDLLPPKIREAARAHELPAKKVSSLAVLLSQLTDVERIALQMELQNDPSLECVQAATRSAKALIQATNLEPSIMALMGLADQFEQARYQSLRMDAEGLLANALKAAAAVEVAERKLKRNRQDLRQTCQHLLREAEKTPELQRIISALEDLTNEPE